MTRILDSSHVSISNKTRSLSEWNAALNKTQSMDILEKHKNPIIKFEEKQRQKIIIKLAEPAGKVIADVGCEKGIISKLLAKNCKKIYCIDIDKNMLRLAKKEIANCDSEFVVADAQKINLPDSHVDVAVSACTLPHLPDTEKGFNELLRITKPNGRIVVHVPNEKLILLAKKILRALKLSFLLGPLSPNLAPGHLHIFGRKKLLELASGKCIVEKIMYNVPFFTGVFAVIRPIKNG
ncbi:MAG: class I SAM-dependent methyltransferase [DPANN group archaeon]|nr:class I SAM-dependent methyltransferase [DPANN group archaeon]